MLNHLKALAIFSKVADAGSFRAAAKELGLSASVVSHHVTALERHLDTPLIYRTTRKLSLTAAGKQLVGSAHAMLNAAETGFGQIGQVSANPTGSLKITAPAVFQYARFLTRLATFMRRFPKVDFSVSFSDRRPNIVEEGFDLALRVGQLKDSSLMSRKLADSELIVCAAPGYLQTLPKITSPKDLENLEVINITGVPTKFELMKKGQNQTQHTTLTTHRISVDSGFAVRRLAEESCGFAILPEFLVTESLATGQLIDVLPDWLAPPLGIYAVWPASTGTNFLRTAFVDFVAEIAKSGLETDREMTGS